MSKLLLLLGVLQAAFGARIQKEHDVSVNFPPSGWVVGSRANPNARISLVIMMKERNLDKLEDIFWSVSDPKNPAYGQYLTFEEMHRITAPDQRAVDTVLHWLHQHHADVELEALPGHAMIRTVVPISVAEELLHAEYHEMHHVDGHFAIRTASYSLPEEVADYIAVVGPTVSFPSPTRPKVSQSAPNDLSVDPTFIRNTYNIGSVESKSAKNRQAATGFIEQYLSVNDLNKFWSQFYPTAVGRSVTIVGPNVQRYPSIQADLDIEYITSIGGNVTTEFWYFNGTADGSGHEPFLDFLYYLGNDTNPPWVVSTSYGEDENTVSLDYANACNVQFQKNGARGISLLFSSGDDGVGSSWTGICTQFVPQWPAASPYLTSVGATTLNIITGATFSAGGFSNRWPLQSWQSSAVSHYLSIATGLPDSSRYNSSGRAYPDIALVGQEYNIVTAGFTTRVYGTVAANPATAGLISLLNDLRFQAGKSSLGYLNQFLYQTAQTCPNCFVDATDGNNPGCNTNGFFAAKGWDPVTGFGGINYGNMAKVVLQLP